MNLTTETLTVAQARVNLDACHEALARLVAARAAKEAELADLESRAGSELLGVDVEAALGRLGDDVGRLRREVELAGVGEAEAAAAVDAATRQLLRAAAARCRQDAVAKRSEATEVQARIDRALAKLVDAAGCDWVPEGSTSSTLVGNDASRLEKHASALDQLAGRATLDPGGVESALAQADPDGPEAVARRERRAAEAARVEAFNAERDAVTAAQLAWYEARAGELVKSGAFNHIGYGPGAFGQAEPGDVSTSRSSAAMLQAKAEFKAQRDEGPHNPHTNTVAANRWTLEQLGVDVAVEAVS